MLDVCLLDFIDCFSVDYLIISKKKIKLILSGLFTRVSYELNYKVTESLEYIYFLLKYLNRGVQGSVLTNLSLYRVFFFF